MIKSCNNLHPKTTAQSLLLVALIIGAVFRGFRLGEVPLGFTWDEVAMAYDAWGIALDGRDHHGVLMPWVFESLGDYKAPGLIYLLALIDLIVGIPSLFTIRLVSAVSGMGLILAGWFLGQKIWPEKSINWGGLALWIALSPWSIVMSRVGFEANLALTLTTWGVVILLSKHNYRRVWGASLLFIMAALTYQSAKITIPLIVIGIFLKHKSKYSFSLLIITLASLAAYIFLNQAGKVDQRAAQVIVGYESGRLVLGLAEWKQLGVNIINHFHPDFIVRGVQANLRQGVPGMGVLTIVDLLILGAYTVLCGWKQKAKGLKKSDWWILLTISLLPSIIGKQAPHALRAAGAIPLLGIAVVNALDFIRNRLKWPIFIPGILASYGLMMGYFWINYFGEYSVKSAMDFQWGYPEVIREVNRLINRADKIYFTDDYGQPYIYVLWYSKIKPSEFLAGGLANYHFGPIKESYLYEPGVIVVASGDELANNTEQPAKIIKQPVLDKVTFKLYHQLNEIQ